MSDNIRIEYSFISKGTEKKGSHGYMAVSELSSENMRFITPQDHGSRYSVFDNTCLACPDIDITNLIVMRFQLIAALAMQEIKFAKNTTACIVGSGPVGVACAIECERLGLDRVLISRRKSLDNEMRTLNFSEINMRDYELFIDCTGNSEVINYIISNCKVGCTLLLIGTPANDVLINALIIHKKNIQLIGGHEINGVTWQNRQDKFDELYLWHKNRIGLFHKYVQFHSYTPNALSSVLNNDTFKPFNILTYSKNS